MSQMAQISAILTFIDFLFGIAIGLVLSVSWASVREDYRRSLLTVAPDAVCAGVRVFNRLYTSDDGYLQHLLAYGGMARWRRRRPGPPRSYGR